MREAAASGIGQLLQQSGKLSNEEIDDGEALSPLVRLVAIELVIERKRPVHRCQARERPLAARFPGFDLDGVAARGDHIQPMR